MMYNSSMSINHKKYQNAILYLCKEAGGTIYGKKKLAKLLYYIDFDRFEYKESRTSITGDGYVRLPMGPVPQHFMEEVETLEKSDMLVVEKQDNSPGYNPLETYTCKKEPDMASFDKDDLKILKRVVRVYGGLNGKQLEDLSHLEAPFLGTEPNEEIAYDLAYYRETQFDEIPKTR